MGLGAEIGEMEYFGRGDGEQVRWVSKFFFLFGTEKRKNYRGII